MESERIRKIVVAGVLGAISALLGWTHWGLIPWFSGAALTVMHIPAIIGAVLEGPVVGAAIGLIFGAFSMLQAAIAPTGPTDVWFTNPLLAVLPRLAIGPLAWLAWKAFEHVPLWSAEGTLVAKGEKTAWEIRTSNPALGLIAAGIVGSLTNTLLVMGVIGVLGYLPWAALPAIIVANGLPEAGASAIITLVVVAAWKRIEIGNRKGANL